MKICYLSHASNYHTIKWCKYFADKGHEVHLISFEPGNIHGVKVHEIDINVDRKGSDIHKLKYLLAGKKIKRIIKEIKPDIVHAHFATSYGIACAVSGISNYFLSVWGYDVYEFPEKSIFHKLILKYSLKRADRILSTSLSMKEQTLKFTNKNIEITPFGVDTNIFRPIKELKDQKCNDTNFIVGTIKLLAPKYGIEYLIKGFKLFNDKYQNNNFQLRIGGNGPDEKKLKKLVLDLGINEKVVWLGYIDQEEVIKEINLFDIVVIPSVSDSESFGVAAVEAQACETPVIVTNVGGLTESTNPGVTSMVIEPRSPEQICEKLILLYENKQIGYKMAKEGRKYVQENFELSKNFGNVEKIYEKYFYENS